MRFALTSILAVAAARAQQLPGNQQDWETILSLACRNVAAENCSSMQAAMTTPASMPTTGAPTSPTVSSGVGDVLPHFAAGGSYVTVFTVMNNSSQAATFSISFYGDSGSPVALPVAGLGSVTTISDTIAGQGIKTYEIGNAEFPLTGGWGQITGAASVTVQALFRNHAPDGSYYEASVHSTPGSTSFVLPFDATTLPATGARIYTGIAMVNLDAASNAKVTCTARDSLGNPIPNAVSVPVLNPKGHWAEYRFPELNGLKGTLQCSSKTKIAAIGLRFLGDNAFSSLPVVLK